MFHIQCSDSSWDTLELASVLEKPQWSLETNSHNKFFFLRDSVAGPGFSKRGFLGVLRPLSSGILKSWWANVDITSWGWEIYSDGWNPILDQNGPVPIPAVPFFCPIFFWSRHSWMMMDDVPPRPTPFPLPSKAPTFWGFWSVPLGWGQAGATAGLVLGMITPPPIYPPSPALFLRGRAGRKEALRCPSLPRTPSKNWSIPWEFSESDFWAQLAAFHWELRKETETRTLKNSPGFGNFFGVQVWQSLVLIFVVVFEACIFQRECADFCADFPLIFVWRFGV